MKGFLITAQYLRDDIPLGLHETKVEAFHHIWLLQKLSPKGLQDIADTSFKVIGYDACGQIEGAELALAEFREGGQIISHEIFGLGVNDGGPSDEQSDRV